MAHFANVRQEEGKSVLPIVVARLVNPARGDPLVTLEPCGVGGISTTTFGPVRLGRMPSRNIQAQAIKWTTKVASVITARGEQLPDRAGVGTSPLVSSARPVNIATGQVLIGL